MPSILVTVKISKGFKTWTEMAKSFEDEMPAEGPKQYGPQQTLMKPKYIV